MKRDEELVMNVTKEVLAQWLDGLYFAAPPDHTGLSANDWQLKLQDADYAEAPLVFREGTTGWSYKVEVRVTRL